MICHGLFCKSGIVGIHDVSQQAHVVDAEPFQLGVLVADIGRLAVLPARDGIDVMQRIAVDVRPAFPDRRDQPEFDRRDADLFPRFANKRRLQALAILDAAADRVPMVGPGLLRGRSPSSTLPSGLMNNAPTVLTMGSGIE